MNIDYIKYYVEFWNNVDAFDLRTGFYGYL